MTVDRVWSLVLAGSILVLSPLAAQTSDGYVTLDEELSRTPEEPFVERNAPPVATAVEDSAPPQELPQPSESVGTADADSAEAIVDDESEAPFSSIPPPPRYPLFENLIELFAPADPGRRDTLRITTSISAGYDDNVFTTNIDQVGSGFGAASGALDYKFGTERFNMNLGLTGAATYYDNRPGDESDYTGGGSLALEYSPSRRIAIEANAGIQYLSQPDPTLIGNTVRFSGDYSVSNVLISASYNIRPRWAVTLGYDMTRIEYADQLINESLGYLNQNFSLSTNYLASPRIALVMEYRYNPLVYYETEEASDGHIVLFGFNYSVTPSAIWTFRLGAESRTVREPVEIGESSYLGPFFETQFAYTYSPNSNISVNLRYGTEPSGVSSVVIRQTFRARLGLDHAFTGRLSVQVAVFYQNDRFDQPGMIPDFNQEYLVGSLQLRYQFAPPFAIFARYEYSAVTSNVETAEYERGITTLGLELIF